MTPAMAFLLRGTGNRTGSTYPRPVIVANIGVNTAYISPLQDVFIREFSFYLR